MENEIKKINKNTASTILNEIENHKNNVFNQRFYENIQRASESSSIKSVLLSESIPIQIQSDEYLIATPPISPIRPNIKPGIFRYLKGHEISNTNPYDLVIIAYRKSPKKIQSNFKLFLKQIYNFPFTLFNKNNKNDYNINNNSANEDNFTDNDFKESVIDTLIINGLNIDIIEAELDKDNILSSNYYILLIRAPNKLVNIYARKLAIQMWLRCGNARELQAVIGEKNEIIMNPADRIQVIDYIIRETIGLSENNNSFYENDKNNDNNIKNKSKKYIHRIFPIHDSQANNFMLKHYIYPLYIDVNGLLNHVKAFFGEKVAYYFAFSFFYNKALIPIAFLGFLLTCFRSSLGTIYYMRILTFWGFVVSVIWSYWFLRSWERKNNELNYLWEDSLHVKKVMYPNPDFKGEKKIVNIVSGQIDYIYPEYKRIPKYFITIIFMFFQIILMLISIACWITIFEIIKVQYPDSSAFSVQWWYILLGGISFGLFIDVVQWNLIVTKVAKKLTDWENWKTIEQYEKAIIRKLFLMDFLNYYTWFFLLAFIYVIPGAGDLITNLLNTLLWNDPSNCCFGPYLDSNNTNKCDSCPYPWNGIYEKRHNTMVYNKGGLCVPCKGWVTFDRVHLDLEQLFLTPIIVTQSLNLLLAVFVPYINKKKQYYLRKKRDLFVIEKIKEKGGRKLIAEMDYSSNNPLNKKYLHNNINNLETLNSFSREIFFQSSQDNYDPYDDYHSCTVQYGFVVMFSMLWPLMPLACIIINSFKIRGDGFRLCQTLKRPYPRKASGIGEWKKVLDILGVIGVIVYVALVFISTGCMEFFSKDCIHTILKDNNNNLKNFHLGPNFNCFGVTERLVLLLLLEHIAFGIIFLLRQKFKSVPAWLEIELMKKEYDFKDRLRQGIDTKRQERNSSHPNSSKSSTKDRVSALSGNSTSHSPAVSENYSNYNEYTYTSVSSAEERFRFINTLKKPNNSTNYVDDNRLYVPQSISNSNFKNETYENESEPLLVKSKSIK